MFVMSIKQTKNKFYAHRKTHYRSSINCVWYSANYLYGDKKPGILACQYVMDIGWSDHGCISDQGYLPHQSKRVSEGQGYGVACSFDLGRHCVDDPYC
jgi:hypothetical protein